MRKLEIQDIYCLSECNFYWLRRLGFKILYQQHLQPHDWSHKITAIILFTCHLSLWSKQYFYLLESLFDDFVSAAVCFFLRGAPIAGSTNGPDQVWMDAFEYEKLELKGTSGGSNAGSIWCEEPNGYPSAPSWCGGGNFSLLLLAFACVIRRRLCRRKERWDF